MIFIGTMKYKEIQLMSRQEIQAKLQELRLQLGRLRFERQSKTLKKSHELGTIKRDIARIQTALHI